MLKCLNDWRAQCTDAQLAAFEALLEHQCDAAISEQTIKNRYAGSYHKALINHKVLNAASATEGVSAAKKFTLRVVNQNYQPDDGVKLVDTIIESDGFIPATKLNTQEREAAAILLQRGVLFEHNGHYCLPAECLVESYDGAHNHWITLACDTSAAMLHQLVPAQARIDMLKPKASRNEMVAWLIVHGQRARLNKPGDQLDESDWSLLLLLQQTNLDDFDALQARYPDLPAIEVTQHYYYNDKQVFSLRKALEQHIPAQLIKLYRLGLIGIMTCSGDNIMAEITLCYEAEKALQSHWHKQRQRIAAHLQKQWQAEPCDAEYLSAWAMDQDLWRLWITLHFLPLGITQQRKLRKNDVKKIAALLGKNDLVYIEFMIFSLLKAELIEQEGANIIPLGINWKAWRVIMRANIFRNIRSWDAWEPEDDKQALKLLLKLPTHCWLKLDEVIEWLRTQSSGRIIGADWMALFTQHHHDALHHLNISQRTVYLLPEFRAVLQDKPITFPAPGWHGAHNKAKVSGFISAAGEIQLPPDCNHKILEKLAICCSIRAIEQVITLQLDDKAIQRMGTDKAALKKTRALLESLQSPLPQAIAYMFDKQQSQQAIAQVASTAMVVLLNDASAIHRLHKTGFEFSQPFKDKPEIILLDASADAHSFMTACSEAGILLDTLIQPVQWISGTASINAWMQSNLDREGQWLEIAYQKTRSSKPKQIIARIEDDFYGSIRIQASKKNKQGYSLLKSMVRLEAKHVLRLRELGDVETTELGLDHLESNQS